MARAVFFRSVTIVTDFLLVFITAMVVIPTLGAWLHQQSGAAQGSLTMAGTIAMWLTPLCFLVIILAAGEIAVMRALWRWGTRRIQKIRDPRAGEADTATTSGPSRGPAAQAGRHGGKNTRTRRT
ncbi:hypothetical protein L3Q67_26890 [Saccharothrix sp. AJ9571]|nr:hypothetical protein L3Q67_26890 [Saccharothrix sp. AJ9571]